jgi:hypothetical protein
MKSEIFYNAIKNRRKIRFLYGLQEIIMEPYYITVDRTGRKVIYGKPELMNEVKKFEFNRIVNIKILGRYKFSPIIPIITYVN